jgi:gentisate 1,2-dioxygenase
MGITQSITSEFHAKTSSVIWKFLLQNKNDCIRFSSRHNAVALDFVIFAPKGKCYTLIGDELDEDGKIKSSKRLDWETGAAFTTPLGLWHSHHNESENEDAWILPVQDAGLSLHQVKFLNYHF